MSAYVTIKFMDSLLAVPLKPDNFTQTPSNQLSCFQVVNHLNSTEYLKHKLSVHRSISLNDWPASVLIDIMRSFTLNEFSCLP